MMLSIPGEVRKARNGVLREECRIPASPSSLVPVQPFPAVAVCLCTFPTDRLQPLRESGAGACFPPPDPISYCVGRVTLPTHTPLTTRSERCLQLVRSSCLCTIVPPNNKDRKRGTI